MKWNFQQSSETSHSHNRTSTVSTTPESHSQANTTLRMLIRNALPRSAIIYHPWNNASDIMQCMCFEIWTSIKVSRASQTPRYYVWIMSVMSDSWFCDRRVIHSILPHNRTTIHRKSIFRFMTFQPPSQHRGATTCTQTTFRTHHSMPDMHWEWFHVGPCWGVETTYSLI